MTASLGIPLIPRYRSASEMTCYFDLQHPKITFYWNLQAVNGVGQTLGRSTFSHGPVSNQQQLTLHSKFHKTDLGSSGSTDKNAQIFINGTPYTQGRIFLNIQPIAICWIEFTSDKTQDTMKEVAWVQNEGYYLTQHPCRPLYRHLVWPYLGI